MTNKESIDAVASLLHSFPGVTSAFVCKRDCPPDVYIRLRCENITTLKQLGRESTWANIRIELSDDTVRLGGEPEDTTDLPFDIVIPDSRMGTPTQTERFGVYLAERLHEAEIIPTAERDRLHSMWNTSLARRGRRQHRITK